MNEMTREEFERLKTDAAEQMREMRDKRSGHSPFPDFVRVPTQKEEPKKERKENQKSERQNECHKNKPSRLGGFLKNVNLPELLKDKDSLLILGLIFLLSNEEADESLMMALAYILL